MAEPLPSRPAGLEQMALWHLGALVIFATWAFGGQAPWARSALLWLGTGGIAIFLAAAVHGARTGAGAWRPWRWIWPLVLFDALTIAAAFNPSFRTVLADGEAYLVQQDPPVAWLPTSAVPAAALRELWLLNGLVLSAHNLTLVSSRRALRTLLLVLAANAAALAVFGTFQDLLGAKGLWFGLVPSPNEYFFSTFIYHNHWGAFALLHTAMWAALLFHHFAQPEARDAWHSPMLAGAVGALLLAATAPLSGSRSSTLLLGLFLLGGAIHFARRMGHARRPRRAPLAPPLLALGLAGTLALGAVGWLAWPMIDRRARQTVQQLDELRQAPHPGDIARVALYRDTWRMAQEKPWFGWGLESYARVFQVYNTQRPPEPWFRTRLYAEAHNDWLQSLAESGFVGTGLLVLLGLLPVATSPWRRAASPLPRYLLAAAALVLLYACVEFPFANPAVLLAFWTALYAAVRHARLDETADA